MQGMGQPESIVSLNTPLGKSDNSSKVIEDLLRGDDTKWPQECIQLCPIIVP